MEYTTGGTQNHSPLNPHSLGHWVFLDGIKIPGETLVVIQYSGDAFFFK